MGSYWGPSFIMRILGVTASGFSDPGDYEFIQTSALVGGETSVAFTNLDSYSSTYTSLQIRCLTRTTRAAGAELIQVRINEDSSSTYSWTRISGNGSSVSGFSGYEETNMRLGRSSAATSEANSFSPTIIDVHDPYSLTRKTSFRFFSGLTGAGTSSTVEVGGGATNILSVVSSIRLITIGSFVAGSRFSIYGIRG